MNPNLYFIDSKGDYRLMATNVDESEVLYMIMKFLKERDFKCFYVRTWITDEGKKYDVGSHTEFFLWGFKNNEN